MAAGRAAFDRGQLDEAARQWQQAADRFAKEKNLRGEVEALVGLGNAYQAMGQYRLSAETSKQAMAVAEKTGNREILLLAKSSFGSAAACGQESGPAERNLRECLALAEAGTNRAVTGFIWSNLGNALAAQGKTAEALEAFDKAGNLGLQTKDHLLAGKAFANAAALATGADAVRWNEAALVEAGELPASHEQALLWLRIGRTYSSLHQLTPAEQSYRRALTMGEKLGDLRARTYALGYLGQLCETQKDFVKALELTRQAAFVAQQLQSPEALYRWEWQTGRVLKAQGEREKAVAAYRRALQSLGAIRQDLAPGSFRESVGPLYFEFADLLLQQGVLAEARDTVEQLKSVELEDYFQDECMTLVRAKSARLETVCPHTAVIYVIPLADRTELLVGLANGLKRFQLPVGAEQLTAEVRKFRANLEKRTTNQYLVEARQLYQWLITPIRETLAAERVDTLVFVPDGALRTIPLAALQDGEHFLIEQFAVTVSPGLTLLAPQPMPRKNVRALVAGLSEATQGFPSLPHTAEEMKCVQQLFHCPAMMDAAFVLPALRKDFTENQYQVVHLASHGQFDKNPNESFILTRDGKLKLDQLEALLRPSRYRGKPVELLTLSACRTAAGDDRAALGLAGVALKAGARSVLATLWYVEDESTAMAMKEFYGALLGASDVSKAKALQQAQIKLLRDPRFEHAGYWSAYLLIGNWL